MQRWKSWKPTQLGLNIIIKGLAGYRYRSLARQAWNMSESEFWRYQTNVFEAIYQIAKEKVPYYKNHPDLYPEISFKEDNILEVLSKLPILKKQTVRQYNPDFWSYPISPLSKFNTTSGTTGTPLKLPSTIWEKALFQVTCEEWYLRQCGVRHPRTLQLDGDITPSSADKELFWRDYTSQDVYLSIYSLSRRNRERVIKLIKDLNPQLIWGYASAVHQLAKLLDGWEYPLKDTRIALVTSEILHPHWRADIERSLCRKVFDFYSSMEGCHEVVECSHGNMHINPLVGIVEILDDRDRPAEKGELGRVVVTGLNRKSMPLIRYEIGDSAVSTDYDTNCSCGLKWPTIAHVEGRLENLVKTRDGRRIGLLGSAVLRDLQGVKESQLVQIDYEKFICNIVKSESENTGDTGGEYRDRHLENTVKQKLITHLQTDVDVEFRYLDSIPRGSRGKFTAIVVKDF